MQRSSYLCLINDCKAYSRGKRVAQAKRGAACKGYAQAELAWGTLGGGRATGGDTERVGASLSCGWVFAVVKIDSCEHRDRLVADVYTMPD